MGKDKDRDKYEKKTQGRCVSPMEILYVMLKYTHILTNINFIKVSTLLLDIWAGIRVDYDTNNGDGTNIIAAVEDFQRFLHLDKYTLHTQK